MKYWAVVPAAGVGARMRADRPKQYLLLLGKTVIEHTLDRLAGIAEIEAVVACVAEGDGYWPDLALPEKVLRAPGGAARSDSVRNGLALLRARGVDDSDWVLVHDAARPCVRAADIRYLMTSLADHPVGGLLAAPVRDTLKKAGEGQNVAATVCRDGLWHALTPQMFRLGALIQALDQVATKRVSVTDDAQAMESLGHQPMLVEGQADNLKITHPRDLALAEIYLQAQLREMA